MKNLQNYSIGILLSFALLALSIKYSLKWSVYFTGVKGLNAENFFFTRICIWIVLIILFLYVIYFEKNDFLIWKDIKYPFVKTVFLGVLIYFIAVLGSGLLNFIIQRAAHENMSPSIITMSKIFKNNYFLLIFTCLTAAITEEFIFRGYIQTRLQKIYNNAYVGIIVSSLLFGILHSGYGTLGQVVGPFFIGLTFAFYYKKYSNIKILIYTHFFIDFIAMMLITN